MGIDLWQQQADGGSFLSTPRSDATTGINLNFDIQPGVRAQIGYMINASTVDFFDYDQVSVNIRFDVDGFKPFGEFTALRGAVILLDMLARASNREQVEQLEVVEP